MVSNSNRRYFPERGCPGSLSRRQKVYISETAFLEKLKVDTIACVYAAEADFSRRWTSSLEASRRSAWRRGELRLCGDLVDPVESQT